MFKNATIFKIALPNLTPIQALDDALKVNEFVPCGSSQEIAVGWVPPRNIAHGAMVEIVGHDLVMRLLIETKAVPGPVLKRKVAEQVAAIEAITGRKPGKKETRDIRDDARLALLPMAFAKQTGALVWIDPVAGLLVIDSASQGVVDEVLTALVKAVTGVSAALLHTNVSPQSFMTEALRTFEVSDALAILRAATLTATDESRAVVRYLRSHLDTGEVCQHIASGKMVTSLALQWRDRVSFTLDHFGVLRGIEFDDVVFEDHYGGNTPDADSFDADVAIMTGELGPLIAGLVAAMGGELAAAEPAQHVAAVSATATHPLQGEPDPMYDQAVEVVLKNRKASISLVQRHLTIGYNRAARLIESMESAGLVSPMESSGQRRILAGA